jgi:hypothetical protein
MRQVLKKDTKFEWTHEHQVDFDDMIKKLTSAPVLQALDVYKYYFLFTDSSLLRNGFAMFQPSNEDPQRELRVIGYAAQALTPSQKSWTV